MIRRVFLLTIMLLSASAGGAAECSSVIALDRLENSNLQEMAAKRPLAECYNLGKRADGNTTLVMRYFNPMYFSFGFLSDEYRPGPLTLRFTGRQFAPLTKITVMFHADFNHALDGECTGAAQIGETRTFQFPAGGNMEARELTFDLAPKICELCDQKYARILCKVQVMVQCPRDNAAPTEDWGIELGKIEVVGDYSVNVDERMFVGEHNVDAVKALAVKNQKWLAARNKFMAQYPQSNRFDAEQETRWAKDVVSGKRIDYAYYTLPELQKINGDFEITRLVDWPFYDPKVPMDYASGTSSRGTVRQINYCRGDWFAVCDTGAVMHRDKDGGDWEYVYDQRSGSRTGLPPVKKLAANPDFVYIDDGKMYRFGEKSELPLPPQLANKGLDGGQVAFSGDGNAYFIGSDKVLYRARRDLSGAKPVTVTLPGEMQTRDGAVLRFVNGLSAEKRLILGYSLAKSAGAALIELDLNTGKTVLKSPPGLSKNINFPVSCSDWLYSISNYFLLDFGPGRMMIAMPNSAARAATMDFALAKDENYYYLIQKSLQTGGYLCAPAAQPDCVLFYNEAKPAESLMLYGFGGSKLIPAGDGGDGVWFLMPDGVYRVAPKKKLAEELQKIAESAAMTSAVSGSEIKTFDLRRVIAAVDAEEPALVGVSWGQFEGREVLIFDVKKPCSDSVVNLQVKLPPLSNMNQYRFEFGWPDGNVKISEFCWDFYDPAGREIMGASHRDGCDYIAGELARVKVHFSRTATPARYILKCITVVKK